SIVGHRQGGGECIRVTLGRSAATEGDVWTPASLVIEWRSLGAEGDDIPGLEAASIYLDSSDTGAAPAISMRRRPNSRVCSALVSTREGETRTKTLEIPPDEDWRLLSQILEAPGPDAAYGQSVVLAAALNG
ncbi:MAG: hypothetical protein ABH877_04795, partial [bacterium]